jgi:hypothetical protein
MKELRKAFKVLTGKPEGGEETTLERLSGSRLEDNIKNDIRYMGRKGVDWIELAKDGIE